MSNNALTDTLVLAFAQCQEQIRKLAEQEKIIDDLRKQNEELKQEIEGFKIKSNDEAEARYRIQFQNAFKQVAEKQAEIERLKYKLRTVKSKAQRHGLSDLITSSPALPIDKRESASPNADTSVDKTSLQTPPTTKHSETTRPAISDTDESLALQRKSLRNWSLARAPLQEISANVDSPARKADKPETVKSTRKATIDKSVAGIPEVAEDGDDHNVKKRKRDAEQGSKAMPQSVYHRLGDLLDTRGPASLNLLRARSSSPRAKTGEASTEASARPSSPPTGLPTPKSEPQFKRPRPKSARQRKSLIPDPEDEEPFRSRPISRLSLTHFKLNPAANDGLDFAYNQVIRGHERKCLPGCTRPCCVGTFKALSATLPPQLTGPNGQPLTEDDLLRNYLGAGSEDRIKNLTSKARENLVHEARTKFLADTYGKMHRDVHERGRSPPGFWRTDMPGSQEHRNDREQARTIERGEVERRYNEALRPGGRWKFADE